MKFNRVWSMPNKFTFNIKPIKEFVKRYNFGISVDPFSNNSLLATYTNDLNPNTKAKYHMKAYDFLSMLIDQNIKADTIIFDPPYSLRQTKECYEGIGINFTYEDSISHWQKEKELCSKILKDDGVFLNFGWNSNGLGKKYGFEIEEILLVSHGGGHYDTICIAEKRVNVPLKQKKSIMNDFLMKG